MQDLLRNFVAEHLGKLPGLGSMSGYVSVRWELWERWLLVVKEGGDQYAGCGRC